jgi:FkbM family methyltransferase
MLKKKVATVQQLFRDGGVKSVSDYAWLRLQAMAKGNKKQVRLGNCIFNLEGVADDSTRMELITNSYEAPERRAIARHLRRQIPVVELGGSMGVVACTTNKLLLKPTAHLVVEANPLVIPLLELNRAVNRCHFEIVNRAIAYGTGSVTFRPSTNVAGSSLARPGAEAPVTVETAQLGKLVRDRGFESFTLVCDIEGVEYDLVCHEADILKRADTIIMETHSRYIGEEKLHQMMTKLEQLGFNLIETIGFVVVLQQQMTNVA